jgi:simple sugar transport system ATP-binding protein
MEICDTVTTLRDGKVVGNIKVSETNPKELAKMMVGREVFLKFEKKPCQPKEVALAVEDLVVANKFGINMVNNVSFELRKGEILGIAGVDGNGQLELCEAITGLVKPKSGKILVKGQEIKRHNTRSFIERNISHIPQDRQREGLVMDFSLKENLILKEFCNEPYSKKGIMNEKASRSIHNGFKFASIATAIAS